MPFIIDLDKQKQAMKDIIAGLKELDSMNRFLNAESADNKYIISLTNSEGEKVTATAYSESKDVIDQLVSEHRESTRAKITELARKYNIDFDVKDNLILENEPAPVDDASGDFEDELVDPYKDDETSEN